MLAKALAFPSHRIVENLLFYVSPNILCTPLFVSVVHLMEDPEENFPPQPISSASLDDDIDEAPPWLVSMKVRVPMIIIILCHTLILLES